MVNQCKAMIDIKKVFNDQIRVVVSKIREDLAMSKQILNFNVNHANTLYMMLIYCH